MFSQVNVIVIFFRSALQYLCPEEYGCNEIYI